MEIKYITEPDHYFEQAMAIYTQAFPMDIQEDIEVFNESFNLKHQDESRYHFICAVDKEEVTGFISFHLETEAKIGFIVYLVVNPLYRGQQIASDLMHAAEEIMLEHCPNLQMIMLECEKEADGSSPLHQFYQKYGFELTTLPYLQPGLHQPLPLPMNLYVKTIGKFDEENIYYIYKVKYTKTNLISPDLIDSYIEHMRQQRKHP